MYHENMRRYLTSSSPNLFLAIVQLFSTSVMQVVSNPRECDVIYGRKQPEYEYVNGTKKILLLISLPPLPRGDSPLLLNGPSVR